MVNREPA